MDKREKFAYIYEHCIKKYRDRYFKDTVHSTSNKENYTFISYIPLAISLLILLFSPIKISSIITAIIISVAGFFLYSLFCKSFNSKEMYAYILHKYGYTSISSYETKLQKYLIGEEGLYKELLEQEKQNAQITENTTKIRTLEGTSYFIWFEAKNNRLGLLQDSITSRPNILFISLGNIRYYRYNKKQNCTILKTDLDDFYFTKEAETFFEKYISEKRIENIQSFDPETYINDYEIYMHKIRDTYYIDQEENEKRKQKTVFSLFLFCIFFIIIYIFNFNFPIFNFIYKIGLMLLFYLFYIQLPAIYFSFFSNQNTSLSSLYNIKQINKNAIYLRYFNELKYALGVPTNAEVLYTNEKAPFLVWVKNGYVHLFLNMIYFNAVYFVVKTKDVQYIKKNIQNVELKLENKTLIFERNAYETLNKMIPNKDYNWLNKMQTK